MLKPKAWNPKLQTCHQFVLLEQIKSVKILKNVQGYQLVAKRASWYRNNFAEEIGKLYLISVA